MSQKEIKSKVENYNGFDTHSGGDTNIVKPCKQHKEENNNDIDELSNGLSEMGCIIEKVKRPPNICVETCVYEESDCESGDEEKEEKEDDAYSDEFEEDKSEEEHINVDPKPINGNISSRRGSTVKLSKSQSFISNKPSISVSGKSSATTMGSVSGRSRRINMSFTNERIREIERHNHILLQKILSARNTKKSSIPAKEEDLRRPAPAAAVMRKKQQKQIDHDNMILLRKIQRAKSSSYSLRR